MVDWRSFLPLKFSNRIKLRCAPFYPAFTFVSKLFLAPMHWRCLYKCPGDHETQLHNDAALGDLQSMSGYVRKGAYDAWYGDISSRHKWPVQTPQESDNSRMQILLTASHQREAIVLYLVTWRIGSIDQEGSACFTLGSHLHHLWVQEDTPRLPSLSLEFVMRRSNWDARSVVQYGLHSFSFYLQQLLDIPSPIDKVLDTVNTNICLL